MGRRMSRRVYSNATDMSREFMKRLGEHRFMADEKGLARFKAWLAEFDLSKLYPEDWWLEKLGCKRARHCWMDSDHDCIMGLVRHQLFDLFNNFVSYSILTEECAAVIKHFCGDRPIHEHMAGTGYWAYHLKNVGLHVEAFDKNEPSIHGVSHAPTFTEVKTQDAATATLPPDAVLMLSWVPHGDNAPMHLLKQMRKGQRFIYIGARGCCGDTLLHDFIDDHFLEAAIYDPPKLMDVRDGVFFYERTDPKGSGEGSVSRPNGGETARPSSGRAVAKGDRARRTRRSAGSVDQQTKQHDPRKRRRTK